MKPLQQPEWPDPVALEQVIGELRTLPPLVFAGECDDLTTKIGAVTRGEAFLLQGGDCAETFDGVTAENIRAKLRVLLQMSVVLQYAASVPVVKVGPDRRAVRQAAELRRRDPRRRDAAVVPGRRGQRAGVHAEARIPDPRRLRGVYNAAAATLNLTRAFTTGGYADLHQVHAWNTDFVKSSPVGRRYEQLATRDRAGARLHARLWRDGRRVQDRRLLRLARGAHPRVRTRADPDRLADRAAVRRRPATCCGWGSGRGSWTARTWSSCRR